MNEALIGPIKMAGGVFAKDLEAMSPEMLSASPGGQARTGYDIAYEITEGNRAFVERVAGTFTPRERSGRWMTCPTEQCKKEEIVADFRASVDAVTSLLASLEPADLDRIVAGPMGETAIGRLAAFLPMHMMYHSGQLNYIQTLFGDDAFHWG